MNELEKRRDYDLFDEFFDEPFRSVAKMMPKHPPMTSIPTNIKETETSYAIEMRIPGYNKENIKAEMLDMTHLKVEVDCEKEEIDEKSHREFFRSEHLSRVLTVNKEIDAGKIKAEYKDGILKLELPFDVKSIEARKIKIG